MATTKEYLNFILGQLSGLEDITYRQMMGEYIIYYKGKIAAEICDNRFLVKPVKSAVERVENAVFEPPYEGAKPMLLIDNVDDKDYLAELFEAIYDELPAPKPKKKKQI
ncbi:MAG TPA: competence protein TfoX [Ruminococcaceae bacterium]|nr:competence protein TfoX [Oscillospiraceae bacterium]